MGATKMSTAITEYKSGLGPKMAALKGNDTVTKLNNELTRRSVSRHCYNKRYTPEQIIMMQLEHIQGQSAKQLAEQYGISQATIYRYLNMAV